MSSSKILQVAKEMSADELRKGALRLVRVTRKQTAELIAHLAEISARKAYLPEHSSMWAYCVEGLGLSEGSVSMRIQVARVCRRFPALLDSLFSSRMSLTVAAKLAPRLTEENADELITTCEGMTRSQVERHLAALSPRAELSSGVRKQKARDEKNGKNEAETGGSSQVPLDAPSSELARVEPASRETFNVRFSASREFIEKVERLAEVLGVHHPKGNLEQLFDTALEMALDKKDPKRKLERRRKREARRTKKQDDLETKPRPDELCVEKGTARTKKDAARVAPMPGHFGMSGKRPHLPSELRELVLERADYRCEFKAGNARCRERTSLQIDHLIPDALGGPTSLENLRCLCSAHNLWAAEVAFGKTFIRTKIAQART